jgi:hypothetical protein
MKTAEQLEAELYDVSVPDWDGEIDFYRELARQSKARGGAGLEVACGDFFKSPLGENSSQMIWMARKP